MRHSGKANTSRNLTRWETEGADGPTLPRAGERFRRKILARQGVVYTRSRKLIVDASRMP